AALAARHFRERATEGRVGERESAGGLRGVAGERGTPALCRAAVGARRGDRVVEPPGVDQIPHALAGHPRVTGNRALGVAQFTQQRVAPLGDFRRLGRALVVVVVFAVAAPVAVAADARVAVAGAGFAERKMASAKAFEGGLVAAKQAAEGSGVRRAKHWPRVGRRRRSRSRTQRDRREGERGRGGKWYERSATSHGRNPCTRSHAGSLREA